MPSITQEDLKRRTKQFALRAIHLAESLPHTRSGDVIASQIIRSGTSVGANYRAA
jgi:four helix bundle protein